MKRREFLSLAAAGAAAATAGCLNRLDEQISDPDSGPVQDGSKSSFPWDSRPVTVAKTGNTGQVDGEDELIRQALSYWSSDGEQYLDYSITFNYTGTGTDADIVFRFVSNVDECGVNHGEDLVGCAPVLDDGAAPDTATARIETVDGRKNVLHTLKHELGHILGLGHEEQPQSVMSNDPADRIEDYEEKQEILEKYNSGIEDYNGAMETYSAALEYWGDENYAEAAPRFEQAAASFSDASSTFAEAKGVAQEIDKHGAADTIDAVRRKAELMREASAKISKAADAYANDDYEAGSTYFDEYETAYERAEQVDVPDGKTLTEQLDLA